MTISLFTSSLAISAAADLLFTIRSALFGIGVFGHAVEEIPSVAFWVKNWWT